MFCIQLPFVVNVSFWKAMRKPLSPVGSYYTRKPKLLQNPQTSCPAIERMSQLIWIRLHLFQDVLHYLPALWNQLHQVLSSLSFSVPFGWASLATLAACSWRFIILSYISLYNNISNRCSQQLVFARSYIKNEKLGIASAALGYPPSEGPINGHNHTPLPRDYRATASSVQMSHFPPKHIIEHSNQNSKQKFMTIPT